MGKNICNTFKKIGKITWWILESRINTCTNFFHNIFNRFIHFSYNRVKCSISFNGCITNRIYRFTSNIWLRICNASMGSNFCLYRRYNIRSCYFNFMGNNVNCKAIYRAKNSKWANRNTSNIYFNCNVYRL